MAHEYNAALFRPLSITGRYSHEQGIFYIFGVIGLQNAERARLFNDGLASVADLVDHYGYDTKLFYTYLLNLNKTYAMAQNPADRVRITPPAIKRLVGLLYHYTHCVLTLHAIPDVLEIDENALMDSYDLYKSE